MLNKQLRAAKIQEEENNLRNQEIIKILLNVARAFGKQELAFRETHDDENGNFVQVNKRVARHSPHFKLWLSDQNIKPYATI